MVSLAGEFTKPDKNLEQENNFQKKNTSFELLDFIPKLPTQKESCVCVYV